MVTIDGSWTMEGLEEDDPTMLRTPAELTEKVNEIGFLPLFKNSIEGFSVEEMTSKDHWWSDDAEKDPWEWRAVLAREGEVAYGKLFSNKAGFVSREWYPYLAAFRRGGYDYDSRYEDGLASARSKSIMELLSEGEKIPSYLLKSMAGFGKGGEKGFDGAMNQLQMQTYVTVRDFVKKTNKKGEPYGWAVGVFSISEALFGEEHVRSAYSLGAEAAFDKIIGHLSKFYPQVDEKQLRKELKG